MSWWVGIDDAEFTRRLYAEQARIQRNDLNPTASEMAQHRRTRRQREDARAED